MFKISKVDHAHDKIILDMSFILTFIKIINYPKLLQAQKNSFDTVRRTERLGDDVPSAPQDAVAAASLSPVDAQ